MDRLMRHRAAIDTSGQLADFRFDTLSHCNGKPMVSGGGMTPRFPFATMPHKRSDKGATEPPAPERNKPSDDSEATRTRP